MPFVGECCAGWDEFERDQRVMVMLGSHLRLPPEPKDDVIVLDEPLPGADEVEPARPPRRTNSVALNIKKLQLLKIGCSFWSFRRYALISLTAFGTTS